MVLTKLRTEYSFGEDAIKGLDTFLKRGKFSKVLIISGKNSAKISGALDDTLSILNSNGLKHLIYDKIQANPLDKNIMEAVQLGKEFSVDLIIAIGGGSVMDSSKVIATLVTNNFSSVLDFYKNKNQSLNNDPLPLVTIPLTAATGSENNSIVVVNLTNDNRNDKISNRIPEATPIFCIEDPKYLKSNSNWNLACGIFDIFCHCQEQYFGTNTFKWTENFLLGNIDTLLNCGVKYLNNRDDNESASNLLWTATMSLNNLSSFNSNADWSIHSMEHGLSGMWNLTHGAGLALLMPSYFEVRAKEDNWFKEKALIFAKKVFNVNSINELVECITKFITDLHLPTKWTDFKEIKVAPTDEELKSLVQLIRSTENPRISDELIYKVLNNIKK